MSYLYSFITYKKGLLIHSSLLCWILLIADSELWGLRTSGYDVFNFMKKYKISYCSLLVIYDCTQYNSLALKNFTVFRPQHVNFYRFLIEAFPSHFKYLSLSKKNFIDEEKMRHKKSKITIETYVLLAR